MPGDLMYGKIIHTDEHFITVDCDLIKVKVPVDQLMKPSDYVERETVWYWIYDNNYKLFYDLGEDVRMKVIDVAFKSKNDLNKLLTKNSMTEFYDENQGSNAITRDMIMEVYCSFNEEGLGPLKWWK